MVRAGVSQDFEDVISEIPSGVEEGEKEEALFVPLNERVARAVQLSPYFRPNFSFSPSEFSIDHYKLVRVTDRHGKREERRKTKAEKQRHVAKGVLLPLLHLAGSLEAGPGTCFMNL